MGSLVTVAVSWTKPLASTVPVLWAIETVVPGTVRVAELDTAVLATEVAVMVTVKSPTGYAVGAVYVVEAPLGVVVGESEPHGPGEQETLQVTPLCVGSLLTVALNGSFVPIGTVALAKAIETVTPETVTVPEAIAEVLATDVAMMVTGTSLAGGVTGAV